MVDAMQGVRIPVVDGKAAVNDLVCARCGYSWREILLMGAQHNSRHPHVDWVPAIGPTEISGEPPALGSTPGGDAR